MTDSKTDLTIDDLRRLLEYVQKNAYKARDDDTKGDAIANTCVKLFKKDYKCSVIHNNNGELCNHYPTKIVILEYQLSESCRSFESVESLYDLTRLKDLLNKARFARCRGRFACPVILFEGKHISRGATISGGVEIYGRSGMDFFFSGGENIPDGEGNAMADISTSVSSNSSSASSVSTGSSNESHLFNRIRGQDIRLLKTFHIGYICDLMVEKKKVKFGMNSRIHPVYCPSHGWLVFDAKGLFSVTSSEKVDKENRYSEFCITSVPYPGCEFFRDWRDNGYMAEGMMFDWNQAHVDTVLDIPGHLPPPHTIDWARYRTWDLVRLTQNYLALLLNYVKEGDCGLLVHCISGWDRTPLFVSLLRLSMWADGVIHQNLSPVEILYLTIAYDWYLFGHNFPDRIAKGEEIFFFCFNFLKYITSEEYSVLRRKRTRSRAVSRTDSECNIDGVLLDPELQRASYRGSNTSISSTSSLNSNKSSIDNAPMYFSAGVEEEATLPNGNPSNHGTHYHRNSPISRGSTQVDAAHSVTIASYNSLTSCSTCQSSTSPMAVPHSIHRVQDTRSTISPNCGSWQLISGTGSYRGSISSSHNESPRSSTSDHSSHNNGGENGAGTAEPGEETRLRKQRLDVVRRIFLSTYSSIIEFKNGTEGGGLSGLFDHFAEKVGFRAPRSTPV